jgi:hypothetical protein
MKLQLFIIAILFSSIAVPTALAGKNSKKPAVYSYKIVPEFKRISSFKVHPSRYIASESSRKEYAPYVYDLKTGKSIQLPNLHQIKGVDKPPIIPYGKDYRYRLSAAKLQNRYWRWYSTKLVYYDGEKGLAGLWLTKHKEIKTVKGAPPCPCGGNSRLIPEFHRYYCSNCKKYIDEKSYFKTQYIQYYAQIDLKKKKLKWMTEVANEALKPIGMDPSGKYFYSGTYRYFYKKTVLNNPSIIRRINIATRKVDWKYSLKLPIRKKADTSGSYSIKYFPSKDYKRIFIWEYDQLGDSKTRGYLKKPWPRGYVVNSTSNSHFEFEVPVTNYGWAFDDSGKYLVFASNQLAKIYRLNLKTQKIDKTIKTAKATYNLVFSNGSKFLYNFHKRGVMVHAFPSLKKAASIPLNRLFKGAKKLLVVERHINMDIGNMIITGKMKEHKLSKTWSSDRKKGMTILKLSK